jgi:hypothetical protein
VPLRNIRICLLRLRRVDLRTRTTVVLSDATLRHQDILIHTENMILLRQKPRRSVRTMAWTDMGLVGKAEGVESEGLAPILLRPEQRGGPVVDGLENVVVGKIG